MIYHDPRVGSRQKGHHHSHDIAGKLVERGVEVESVSLEFGDFVFIGNGPDGPVQVGIELKTVSDFLTSMLSGRLAGHQIPGLTNRYDRTYLVIEGYYRVRGGLVVTPQLGSSRPLPWESVEKFITGLEESGVRIRWSKSSNDTVRIITSVLYSFWCKPYEQHESIHTLYRPPTARLTPEDEATRRLRLVASSLPGIGHTRSKAVAQAFRSIYNLVTSSEGDWEGVEGIGAQLSRGVMKAIRETIPVTGSQSRRVSAGSANGHRRARGHRRPPLHAATA